ncbi:MAG: ABC transporter permease [Chloroflexota bacterium]|nr:ABC transporter permease [Chloroflexota bacterium]
MRVIDLAFKDLLQIFRDWQTALFLVAMPLVFTLFFGWLSGSEVASDPRLSVGFVDRDQNGTLGDDLQRLLEASGTIRLVILEEKQVERVGELVRDQKLAAAVIIPAGFSEQTLRLGSGQALTGEKPRLTVIVDHNTSAGRAAGNAVRAATTRLLGAVETARLSAETFEANVPFENQAARRAYLDESLALASTAWSQPPLTVAVGQTGEMAGDGEEMTPNAYTQSSPGMIVQFVIFGLNTSAMVLVLERKSRALQRLLTTAITRVEVIAGHVLAMFTVVFLQQVLLIAVGQLVFGVDYMREPLAILLVMVTLALWVASLGLLIGAISKGEEQVIVWSLVAMFTLSALGGAWFPLDITGETFSTIGHLTPTAWAMDGFQNIVMRGLGLESVLLPAGILLAYAVFFFGLALWRFRFE